MKVKVELELVKILDGKVDMGGEELFIRIEVLRSVETESVYVCRFLRREFYRIQPTFPQDKLGAPEDHAADEEIWVDWSSAVPDELIQFEALSPEEAVAHVLAVFS